MEKRQSLTQRQHPLIP